MLFLSFSLSFFLSLSLFFTLSLFQVHIHLSIIYNCHFKFIGTYEPSLLFLSSSIFKNSNRSKMNIIGEYNYTKLNSIILSHCYFYRRYNLRIKKEKEKMYFISVRLCVRVSVKLVLNIISCFFSTKQNSRIYVIHNLKKKYLCTFVSICLFSNFVFTQRTKLL